MSECSTTYRRDNIWEVFLHKAYGIVRNLSSIYIILSTIIRNKNIFCRYIAWLFCESEFQATAQDDAHDVFITLPP